MHEHASLNRIFRLVWSAAQGCWIAVHEHARGRSKAGRSSRSLTRLFTATALALGLGAAYAAPPPAVTAVPQGAQVVAGQAQVQQNGANLVITQSTARTAIDWQSFDIGSGASVAFRQPDSSSVALNRVLNGQPSQIFGRLTSNGQVFLSNASGVYFSPTASVDVGGLVATTHSLSTADFMTGKLVFNRDGSTASVVNEGQINAAPGGYLALLAPEVRNSGLLVARAGTVALGAGEAIELQFEGGSLAKLRVTPAAIATLIENRQAVRAPDGLILMSARAAQELQGGVIKNSGELSASSLTSKGGRIVLEADQVSIAAGSSITATGATGGGQINIGGAFRGGADVYSATRTSVEQGATIDASATQKGNGGDVVVWSNDRTNFNGAISARGAGGGDGGNVETSGKSVLSVRTGQVDVSATKSAGTAAGKGGTWLLDPNDLTIGNTADTNIGGSFGTTDDDSFLSVTSLNAALTNGSNVTVLTNSAGTNLGLGDITVNGAIVASTLTSGQTASLTLAAQGGIYFATGGSISAGAADRSLNVNLLAGTALGGGSAGSGASEIGMAAGTSINTGLSGNLTAVARRDITLANITLAGGNLSVTSVNNGAVSQTGAAIVGGTSSVSAGTGDVSLNNVGNQLTGAISSAGSGAVTIRNTIATNLGTLGTSGAAASSLDVTTSNAAITQSGAAFVSGEAAFKAGSGAVTVNNAGNQLSGVITSTGTGAVTVANSVATNLGNMGISSAAAASLAVTTSNNAVTQSGTSYVTGATSVAAGSGAVSLTNSGNQLAGAISSTGTGVVSIRNAVATNLGAIGSSGAGNAAASLTVRTSTGAVTQSAAAFVTGITSARSDSNGNITLNNAGNQLAGAITTIGSGAVTLTNDVATTLGQIGSSGTRAASLTVTTTNDAVTQAGAAYVDGTTSVNAGTGAVTLDNSANKFAGALSSSGTGAVAVTNTLAVVLGNIGTAGAGNAAASLSVSTPNAAVSQTGTAYVAGTTAVSAGSGAVTLDAAANELSGAISSVGRGDVTINNNVATVLGGIGSSSIGGSAGFLSVTTANNALTQIAPVYVANATTLSTGSGAITLTNSGNDFGGAVSVTNTGAASVTSGTGLTATFNGSAATAGVATGALDATLVGTGATTLSSATVAAGGTASSLATTSTGTTTLSATTVTGNLSINSGGAVTQSAALSAAGLELNGAGPVTLTNAANSVGTIAAGTGAGAVSYVNAGALAVGTVNTAGITRTGTVALSTVTGDLTLNQSVSTSNASSSAVTLNAGSAASAGTGAGGNLIVNGGSTVSVGSGGRATLYSGTVAGSTGLTALVGSGSGNFRYNSDETASNFTKVLGAGVVAIYREQPTVTVTADNLTQTYGVATVTTTSLAGNVNGDTAAQIFSTAPSVAVGGAQSTSGNYIAGSHSLTAAGGVDALGYTVSYAAPGTLTVNQAVISAITGITANNRVYDTTTGATLNTGSAAFTGEVSGDVLTAATATGAFVDKNAGVGKTVNITGLTLGGADAGNYTLASTTATTTATITPAAIANITGITAADKVYNGNTTAALTTTGAAFSGILGADVLSVGSSTGNFVDKNAGVGKTVNITGLTLAGADAGNYTLTTNTATTTATITQAAIANITGITAADRVYDSTTAATLATGSAAFTGMVAGDVLTVGSSTGNFTDKNVGVGKTVNITGLTLGGTDAGNYTLTTNTASTTASISKAALTAITGITAADKIYDATTAATLDTTGIGYTGMFAGDVLTPASAVGTFGDKNVGVGKTVTIALTLGGADAGNYTLPASTTTTATITKKDVTAITGITAADKVYDGNTTAALTTSGAGFTGGISGDVLNVATATGNFTDKNAAVGKTVNITGLSLGGTDAGNYNLTSTTASTTATISQAVISAIAGITANNKVYDTTTAATLNTGTAAFTGMVSGDVLTAATATGAFVDKNAGVGKTVNITGLTLGGADAGNYTLASTTATTTATITPAAIANITGITAADKVYNGNTAAALTTTGAAFTGILGADVLTVGSSTGNFVDKNAGVGKTVNITGLTLAGADAGNYTLTTNTASTTATITPAAIANITGITAADRVYNATTAATLATGSAAFTGMVAGDVLTVASSTGNFTDKNVGVGKTVNITGLTLGGTDAGNYTLTSNTASTTASISKAALTAITGITAADKIYDATTAATLNTSGIGYTGMFAGDVLTPASAVGTFSDKNVGVGKTVNIALTLGGADAGNYSLPASTTTTATITKKDVTAITGITAADKVYDGNTTAALTTTGAGFTGGISGDVLNVATATGNFTDKNAAVGKTVNITGLSLGGTDAGNYNLTNTTASTTATISKAVIAAITGITANNRVYDTTTAATLNTGAAAFTGEVSGDVLTAATATGAFTDKNAGVGKTVNITGLSLGGADAGNYALASSTATTTATITPAAIANITGITAADKVYNGNTTAALVTTSAAFTGILGADVLTVGAATGNFSDKNAGVGKTVNITGLALGGTDAGNYTLTNTTASTTATISKAVISAISGITANNRVYDTTTAATLNTGSAVFAGEVSGDVLTAATATGAFTDKNAGVGKTVNITGLTLGGTDAGNYTLASSTATTTATISKAALTAITGITAANKVYDAATSATLNTSGIGYTGIFAGDVLTPATAVGTFSDKNVGVGKTVNVALTLGGADAGNYSLPTSTTTTATITKADLASVSGIQPYSKIEDGSAVATLNTSHAVFNGMFTGDQLTVAQANGLFNDALSGLNKPVSITGITLGGTDAGNYKLLVASASGIADIIPLPAILPQPPIVRPGVSNLSLTNLDAAGLLINGVPAMAVMNTADAAGGIGGGLPVTTSSDVDSAEGAVMEVRVPRGMLASGFTFVLPDKVQRAIQYTRGGLDVVRFDGRRLPDWLRFDPATMRFSATGPVDDVLPIRLLLQFGSRTAKLVITGP